MKHLINPVNISAHALAELIMLIGDNTNNSLREINAESNKKDNNYE